MLVEKKTLGHLPAWTRAPTSVPGAPASSGRTSIQAPSLGVGAEITAPLSPSCALLCTCHPPRPMVRVLAEATAGTASRTKAAQSTALRAARDTSTPFPFSLAD